jgi:hypothetical protein
MYTAERKMGEGERKGGSNVFTFAVNEIEDEIWKVQQRDSSSTKLKRSLIYLRRRMREVTN